MEFFFKPGHEESYEGSPPSSHDYSSAAFEDSYHPQNNFGAASDGMHFISYETFISWLF